MYNKTLHHDSKLFCFYCLQFFTTAEILEKHANFLEKSFKIYVDFDSILVAENNGKQNLDESYTNKYQNHVGCSFDFKSICVVDCFSKPFTSYLSQDAVHKFVTSMVKERKYCSRLMKKHFNKGIVMTKEDYENFENYSKCLVEGVAKVG